MSRQAVVDTVVLGAGQAGCEIAFGLRQAKYAGTILLLGEEEVLPYRRPPLSKAYLSGELGREGLLLKPAATYERFNIDVRLGVSCVAIDRAGKTLQLSDGSTLGYGKLAIATGGQPRQLQTPGAEQAAIHYIRTITDIDRLSPELVAGRRLIVIGAGFIGLEAAAVARSKGLSVSVIEAMPRVLERVTAPEMSEFYEAYHRSRGVELHTGVGVQAFECEGDQVTAVLTDGSRVVGDLVIAGIGLAPSVELAREAGLEVRQGLVVDEFACTSDPDIVAAGDCAEGWNTFLGRHARVESVGNAIDQARVAVASLMGQRKSYDSVPWFWSDQYDLKLQMVGVSTGYQRVVLRGQMHANSFCLFYLKGNQVIAVDVVNRPREFAQARRLVEQRIEVEPARLIDEQTDLGALLRSA